MRKVIPVQAVAEFLQRKKLTEHVYELTFKIVKPLELDFLPGQYIAIEIDQKTRRQYSISSSPLKSKSIFDLLIDTRPNGIGTKFLMGLNPGNNIEFIGQIGHLTLADDLPKDLFFIATGTGIAPLKSMIETLVLDNRCRDHNIYVIFGTRFKDQLFYRDLFDGYLQDGKIHDYKVFLSRDEVPGNITGRVSELINIYDKSILEKGQFYMCGGGEMLKSMESLLIHIGVSQKDILYEKFY